MSDIDYFEQRREALQRWVAAQLPGATDVGLSTFTAAGSGFSNITRFTDLSWTDRTGPHVRELVLRAQPPGEALFADYDLRLQYDVMAALRDTVIPVPRVAWYLDDPELLGGAAFFMNRVHGEVASGFRPGFHGRGLFFDATVERRRSMWFASVDVMAALHSLDANALMLPTSLGACGDGEEAVASILSRIEGQLDLAGECPAVLRQAVGYLRDELPSDLDTALCWGDPRPGNIIYRDGEVAAVLDWELAHYGPPEGDLAYFLLVDEVVAELNDVPRLAGLPSADETVARYEDRTGRTIKNLEYHRVLQALRMAAMLVLTVRLSPPELTFPPNYLTDNVPTRRLAELLRNR